jgi:SAM-dependent methyltransferase
LDVVEYIRHGARVTAVDLSPRSVELTRHYLDYCGLEASVQTADAEELPFEDETFDLVVARGVLMYTPRPQRAVDEIHRVLRPGGEMLAMLHNRYSWFAILALTSGTNLYDEARDPPINRLHTGRQARQLFGSFRRLRITRDKFPAPTDRRHGFFAGIYNSLFVPLTRALPRALMEPLGYYLILQGIKPSAREAGSSLGRATNRLFRG